MPVITKDRLIQLLQDSPCPGDTAIWLQSGGNPPWPAYAVLKDGPWGANGEAAAHLVISDQSQLSYDEPSQADVICDLLEQAARK